MRLNPDASVDVFAPRQELMAGGGQTVEAAYLQLARRIVAETIHYGESEEGIVVLPLPWPEGPLQ